MTGYTYDEVGNQKTSTNFNGEGAADDVLSTYAYDGFGRLEGKTVERGGASGTPLFSQEYVLDDDGQRLKSQETLPGGAETDITWKYDDLKRLTKETYNSSNDSLDFIDEYAFDLNSNRLIKKHDAGGDGSVDVRTRYVYNDRDELTSDGPDANNDGVIDAGQATTYSYDANGSTTSVTATGATKQYKWDLRNRML